MKLRILLLVIILAGLTCCAEQVRQAVFPTTPTRTAEQQFMGAALVVEMCKESDGSHIYQGSAVILSDYRLLTAAHLTSCDGELVALMIDAGDGLQPAMLEVILPHSDIARLWVHQSMHEFVSPIAIGARPVIGETICEAATMPRVTYRCGVVQPSPDDGDIFVGFQAEHGNSGAGVYSAGKLVGITVRQSICESGVSCVGAVAALQDYPWLLEF